MNKKENHIEFGLKPRYLIISSAISLSRINDSEVEK